MFRQLELEAVEHARPDLAFVALPFLRYPGVADGTLRRTPELAPLVRSFLELDQLRAGPLQALADRRPTLLELDTSHIAPADYAVLVPEGALYGVACTGCSRAPLAQRALAQADSMRALERALGASMRDADARRLLLWLRYMDALYFAAEGARRPALDALDAAVRLYPKDAHLRALLHAVRAQAEGRPLDVRPYLRLDATRAQ